MSGESAQRRQEGAGRSNYPRQARQDDAPAAGQATFDYAEVPDDRYSLSVTTLGRRLHVSTRTAQRILADLQENGWLLRYEKPSKPGKITGLLRTGHDFVFNTEGLCPVDGRPLPSPRSKFCCDRCRKAAERDRKRDTSQVRGYAGRPVRADDTRTDNELPDRDMKPDGVTFHDAHGHHPDVTNPRSEAKSAEEHSVKEEVVGGQPLADLEPCSVCHTPMDPVLPESGCRTHPNCDPDEKPWSNVVPIEAGRRRAVRRWPAGEVAVAAGGTANPQEEQR
jgi:hypothetical protein